MKTELPKVTVIVPIYQVEPFIRKCVDSIINQTYSNLEIILVDDGSLDGSPAVCDEYHKRDARITVIHKENGGLSDARNAGLDVATGEYVTFIDGDDYYASNTLETLVKDAIQSGAEIVCMGAAIVSSDYASIRNENPKEELLPANEYFRGICEGSKSPSVCTKLFKRDVIGDHRFKKKRLNEDFFFTLSMLFGTGQVRTIPFVGYYYYQREGSITHSGNKQSLYDAIQNCIDHVQLASIKNPALVPYVARMGIHQASVMIRVIPEAVIDRKNENLNKAMECLKICRPYLFGAKLSLYEKTIAQLALLAPVATAKALRIIRRWIG